jgi:hypothetical protein
MESAWFTTYTMHSQHTVDPVRDWQWLGQLHDWILSEIANRICPMRSFREGKYLFGHFLLRNKFDRYGHFSEVF